MQATCSTKTCIALVGAAVWLTGLPAARATVTVWFRFEGGLTNEQQQDVLRRVHQKFEFTVGTFNVGDNLRFVTERPNNVQHDIIFDNMNWRNRPYGGTVGTQSIVFQRVLTDGRFRNFFDTDERRINAIADTAAHEIGHQFLPGGGHNCNAPREETEVRDADNRRHVRMMGNGQLVNNRPGLMADGRKVTPAEVAADQAEFTNDERRTIADTLQREKGGRDNRPAPGDPQRRSTLQFIEGERFHDDDDPPQPEWHEPYPLPRFDGLVDLHATLSGSSLWDFGFATIDGGFIPLIGAGQPDGMLAFQPGDAVDFAIRLEGSPEESRLTMSQIGSIDLLSDPVDPGRSVNPMVLEQYYRRAVLRFDPDPSMMGDEVYVELQADPGQIDLFDGFRAVPEPPTALLVLSIIAGLRRRRSLRHLARPHSPARV